MAIVCEIKAQASPYNGDAWAWIKARIRAGNYTGIYIKDFIPFTTTNNLTLHAEVAGINTYTGYGYATVDNHIDFISRELWPAAHKINPVNYNNGLDPEITGADTRSPWLASDLYHWLNSLAGQVPNSGGLNPAVKPVDYTQDGVYYYLPDALKDVIIEKFAYLPRRYSASELLTDDNAFGWTSLGKLWLPTEFEVYGSSCWCGTGGYSTSGNNVQYPIFAHNMTRVKYKTGSWAYWWLLSAYAGNTTHWCAVHSRGIADHYNTTGSSTYAPVCFRVG